jgi:hypothetical protein
MIIFRLYLTQESLDAPLEVLPLASLSCLYITAKVEGANVPPRHNFITNALSKSIFLKDMVGDVLSRTPHDWQVLLETDILFLCHNNIACITPSEACT